jgi:hypothetical protein
MLNARSYLQSARRLNPAVFYIPTSDTSGVIFQPPPGSSSHHRQHSSYGYSNGEYHVRSLGSGVDEEDVGETINELGLPLFKLGSFKPTSNNPALNGPEDDGQNRRKRLKRKPGTPTSTAASTVHEGNIDDEDDVEKNMDDMDEIDGIFESPILPRNRTQPPTTSMPTLPPTPNSLHSIQSPPQPLEIMVQTSKQESYSSHTRGSSFAGGRSRR